MRSAGVAIVPDSEEEISPVNFVAQNGMEIFQKEGWCVAHRPLGAILPANERTRRCVVLLVVSVKFKR
jgi:hypothetical protein